MFRDEVYRAGAFALTVWAVWISTPGAASASAPSLTAASTTGVPGQTADIAVAFSTGDLSVALMEFDMVLPPGVTPSSSTAGPIVGAAAKVLYYYQPAPQTFRVLIAGINQNVIDSGVAVTLTVVVGSTADSGLYSVSIVNISMSTPAGGSVPGTGTDGPFTITGNQPPYLSPPTVAGVWSSSATISWTSQSPASSQINYGLTASYGQSSTLDPALTTTHAQTLTGLSAATLYHFDAASQDGGGHLATSGDFTLTTDTTTPSGNPPAITLVSTPTVFASSVTVTWATDEPSTSQIDYGPQAFDYLFLTNLDPNLVLSHSQIITGLTPNTVYHYRVQSQNNAGQLTVATDAVFTTSPPVVETSSPQISGVTGSALSPFSAQIAWTTDEPADSDVQFGFTPAYGSSTTLDPSFTTAHVVQLDPLTPGATYHYSVLSRNPSGNLSQSGDFAFSLPPQIGSLAPPSITVGSTSTAPGGQASLAVSFAPGTIPVSSVQFDLTIPSPLSPTQTATGAAAGAAGEIASGALLPGTDTYRVSVFGFNQVLSQSGELALVQILVAAGAAGGTIPIAIGNASAFDQAGHLIQAYGSPAPATANGSVTVVGGGGGGGGGGSGAGAGVTVYPNPWRSDRNASALMTFTDIQTNSEVKIFNAAAYSVRRIPATGATVSWDLNDDSGRRVASGLYFYRVTNAQGQGVTGELVVIK